MQFHAGVGTALGKDYTLFALSEGIVEFKKSKYSNRVSSRLRPLKQRLLSDFVHSYSSSAICC